MSGEHPGWSLQRITFNRDDGLPKYIAIARAISSAITEDELPEGTPLPSQKELADSFGVTVMTVRQAVKTLLEQGLVSSEQGKGTFVLSRPYRLPLGALSSFAAQMEAAGRTLRTELLSHSIIEVSPLEQRRMSLTTRQALELVRLRHVDGRPIIVQTSLLPVYLAEAIDLKALETRSLYAVLARDLGVKIGRATETVQATILDRQSAALLGRKEGDAALLSARLTFSTEGRAIVDDRALAAGDSVVISSQREADESGLELMLASDTSMPVDAGPFVRGGHLDG